MNGLFDQVNATSSGLLDSGDGVLAFRIHGSQLDGQTVQVRASKCAVGSHAGCQLRLRANGLRPVYCWIVRGQTGAFVRRWSKETRLNGHRFEAAPLEIGDRLSFGPIELELVSIESSPVRFEGVASKRASDNSEAPYAADPSPIRDGLSEKIGTLEHLLDDYAHERERQVDSQRVTQQKLDELAAIIQQRERELAELRQTLSRREARLTQLEIGQTERERAASNERANWAAARDEFARQAASLQTSLGQARRECDAASSVILALREELAGERQNATRIQSTLEQKLADLKRSSADELASANAASSKQVDEIATLTTRLTQLQDELESERVAAREDSECRERETAALMETVESLKSQIERQRETIEQIEAEHRADHDAWLAERRQFLADLEQRDADLERVNESLAAAEATHQQLAAERESLETESARKLEEFERQQESWSKNQQALRLQLDELKETLDETRSKLEERDSEDDNAHRLVAEMDELRVSYQRLKETIAAERSEWADERQRLDQQIASHESDSQQLEKSEARLRATESELEQWRVKANELMTLLEQLQRQPSPPQATETCVPSVPAEESDAPAAADLQHTIDSDAEDSLDAHEASEALEHLRQLGLLKSNDDEESPANLDEPSGTEDQEELIVATTTISGGEPDGLTVERSVLRESDPLDDEANEDGKVVNDSEEHESIEAYMDRLLKRVRRDEPAEETGQVCQPPADFAERQPKKEEIKLPAIVEPSEYMPRSRAPEKVGNMNVMREVANESARRAISRSTRQQWNTKAVLNFVVAAMIMLTALVILIFYSSSLFNLAVALILVGVAVAFGTRAIMIRRSLAQAPTLDDEFLPDAVSHAESGDERDLAWNATRERDDSSSKPSEYDADDFDPREELEQVPATGIDASNAGPHESFDVEVPGLYADSDEFGCEDLLADEAEFNARADGEQRSTTPFGWPSDWPRSE